MVPDRGAVISIGTPEEEEEEGGTEDKMDDEGGERIEKLRFNIFFTFCTGVYATNRNEGSRNLPSFGGGGTGFFGTLVMVEPEIICVTGKGFVNRGARNAPWTAAAVTASHDTFVPLLLVSFVDEDILLLLSS